MVFYLLLEILVRTQLKLLKIISNEYGQKLADTANKTNEIKTASKRAIQKTAEATGDLVGNGIAGIAVHQENHAMKKYSQMKLIMKYQKRDIFLQKKSNKLLMN